MHSDPTSDQPAEYHGPDRRKSGGTMIQAAAAGAAAGTAAGAMGFRGTIWTNLANASAMVVLCFVLIIGGGFFLDDVRTERAERRSRDSEEREIRRAEVAAQDRRSEQVQAELRLMRTSFEAIATRMEASSARMDNAKQTLERLNQELKELVQKIIDAFKNPMARAAWEMVVPRAVKAWFSPEVAPMPRKVTRPAGSPEPAPDRPGPAPGSTR